jgi:hypothetical protein
MPGDKPVIAVWFSCGAASAAAAFLTAQKYGASSIVRVVNNPVKEEDEDNRRFLLDVQKWIGVDIEQATNPMYPEASAVAVWAKKKYMSGTSVAPCTGALKKDARYEWEKHNHADWHVLGFTADEKKRYENFIRSERENVLPVLIDAGMTKIDCYRMLEKAGIEPPRIYKMGYPNANCIGCVKATSPTYWNHVRAVHPDVYRQRAEQSRELGVRLARHKGVRVFLDQLPPDARGRPMKNLDFECGIFCEETANAR